MRLMRRAVCFGLCCAALGASGVLFAAPSEIAGDWEGKSCVAQIVAATNGEFRANLLQQFNHPDQIIATPRGQVAGEAINFSSDGWSGTLADGVLKFRRGDEAFELNRIVRHSPTENAKPPLNAVVLFDGSNLDAWAKQKRKAWEEMDGPVTGWKLQDGVLEVVPGTGSIITKRRFGDFRLHVEFRTLGPVNSGVYLQTRYEVGISESYGKLEGSFCGGFGNVPDAPTTKINASLPPFQWQTLDIEFRAPHFDAAGKKTENPRATVVMNGVMLADRVELPSVRGAAKRLGEAATASLMLQEHGDPVQFRNIWLVEMSHAPK